MKRIQNRKEKEREYNRRDLYRSEERRKNIIEMRLDENVKEQNKKQNGDS